MNLDRINVINHELSNFKNSIDRLKIELDDIESSDIYECNQLCETLTLDSSLYIEDVKILLNKMKQLEQSGTDGIYAKFEEYEEKDYDGWTDYYTKVSIYGDKKYAQEKLDKRKAEIILEIESYNKRIEDYKEQLKVEVNRES